MKWGRIECSRWEEFCSLPELKSSHPPVSKDLERKTFISKTLFWFFPFLKKENLFNCQNAHLLTKTNKTERTKMGRIKRGGVRKRKIMNWMYLSWLQTHVEKENGGIYWKWWPQIHRQRKYKEFRKENAEPSHCYCMNRIKSRAFTRPHSFGWNQIPRPYSWHIVSYKLVSV